MKTKLVIPIVLAVLVLVAVGFFIKSKSVPASPAGGPPPSENNNPPPPVATPPVTNSVNPPASPAGGPAAAKVPPPPAKFVSPPPPPVTPPPPPVVPPPPPVVLPPPPPVAPQEPQEPDPVSVSISGFAFSPQSITVPKGTKVTWTNLDSSSHTVTSDSGVGPTSSLLPQGTTYSFTFTTPGTYPYHCSPHPSMTGTVVVTE